MRVRIRAIAARRTPGRPRDRSRRRRESGPGSRTSSGISGEFGAVFLPIRRKPGGIRVAHCSDRAFPMEPVRRSIAASLVAMALLALPLPRSTASGQQPAPFASGVSLVALNVTVQDETSRYVPGLGAGDFAVYEDGIKQQVRFVEAEAIPIDLIVMLDTSRSMTGKVAIVQTAARGFLETLRPEDRGAVVAFSDRVNLLEPLTSDRQLLSAA